MGSIRNYINRIIGCIFKWLLSVNDFRYWKWFGKNTAIGIGMWLGIIMAYNVWFIIWPNQKSIRYREA